MRKTPNLTFLKALERTHEYVEDLSLQRAPSRSRPTLNSPTSELYDSRDWLLIYNEYTRVHIFIHGVRGHGSPCINLKQHQVLVSPTAYHDALLVWCAPTAWLTTLICHNGHKRYYL